MAETLLLLFISLSITTNLFNNALADPSQDIVCPSVKCPESRKASFLVFFGDAHFDVGFGIHELCLPSKYPPYGQKLKSQTGRFSDGYTIPDFIAEYVLGPADKNVIPYTCDLTKTTTQFNGRSLSFAQAGAVVLEGISKGKRRTLRDQVDQFVKLHGNNKLLGEASERIEGTLYLISIGTFDYLREIKKENLAPDAYIEVVKNILEAVKNLIDKGGRRFAFMNIGPLRYYPVVQKLELGEEKLRQLDLLVQRHNEKLKEGLAEVLKDSAQSYSILDYHSIIKNIMEKPGLYGFDAYTIKSACCGRGPLKAEGCGTLDKEGCGEHSTEEYVFFDGIHHTEHINHHLAKIFWNSNELATPNNLKSIAGLAKTEFDFPVF